MTSHDRERLVYHGAVVMLVGLLCGFPAVTEAGDEGARLWRAAHLELFMIGMWLVATAAVLPLLVLARREALGLVWALIVTGYSLMIGLLIGAASGVRAITPAGSAATRIAFSANAIGILGSLVGVLLTLTGARAALKRPVG